MGVGRRLAGLAALLVLGVAATAGAQQPAAGDVRGYCVPENTQFDPADVQRPGAPPVELPAGFTERRITFEQAGFSTRIIEAGPPDAEEAVVFMHGNPGSSLDFAEIFQAVPPGTRVVAFDMLGFGAADKPYDFPYTFEAARPLVDQVFEELGIERMHLVGHDVGSVVGIDWAARHPEKLESAVMIAGGLLIGWVDHHFGLAWRMPFAGEEMMRMVDREGFVNMMQLHNPRPLPREFLDRNYDHFDRGTRCAILKIYRSRPDSTLLGLSHAEALRPHDIPALVIWGDRDPFLPSYMAFASKLGFPSADVHVFPNSGHWPFVDTEQRTIELMSEFLRRQG